MQRIDLILIVCLLFIASAMAIVFVMKSDSFTLSQNQPQNSKPETVKRLVTVDESIMARDRGSNTTAIPGGKHTGLAVRLIQVDGQINGHENPVIQRDCEFALVFAENKEALSLEIIPKQRAKVLQYYFNGEQRMEVRNIEMPYRVERSFATIPAGKYEIMFRLLDSSDTLHEVTKSIYVRVPADNKPETFE